MDTQKCDQCGRVERYHIYELTRNIHFLAMKDEATPLHFCGTACLHAWAAQHK